ncbi:MAG: cysteine desulfurase, partial [Bacteroidota bacterium]
SNIVPWQMSCEEHGASLKVLPFSLEGELLIDGLEALINERTRIIALTHVSNTLGTVNDIRTVIKMAHAHNIPVLIDGAQAVAHLTVDVQELDCDFYCFSGHKMYAPMGIGVLYGKEKLLEELPPYQGGGEMIKSVTFEKTTYNELPFKFEAGTPNVGDVIGLDVAIQFLQMIGLNRIAAHEQELLHYATQKLLELEEMRIIGTAKEKTGVVSFNLGNIHPYDAGTILDKFGIAVRTGTHCTQPIMDFLQIPGTIRASFAMYNTKAEIDVMVEALNKVKVMFG